MENKANLSSSEKQPDILGANAELAPTTIPFELFDLAEASDEKASILADFLDNNAKLALERVPDKLFDLAKAGFRKEKILANFLDKNAKLVLEIAPDKIFGLAEAGYGGEMILFFFLFNNAKLALKIAPDQIFNLVKAGPIGEKILTDFLKNAAELALKIAPDQIFNLVKAGPVGEKILTDFLRYHAELALKIVPDQIFNLVEAGAIKKEILTYVLNKTAKLIAQMDGNSTHKWLTAEFIAKHNIKLFDLRLEVPEGLDPVIKSLISKMHIKSSVTPEEKNILTSNLILLLQEAIKTPAILTLFKSASHIEKPINLYIDEAFNRPNLNGNAWSEYGIKIFKCASLLQPLHKNAICTPQMIECISTLLHECTHMVLNAIYSNNWQPFSPEDIDIVSKQLFTEILESLSKEKTPYSHYTKDQHIVEIPAFLSSAIMMQTLKRFSARDIDQEYKVLLNHEKLAQYMRAVYKVANFDSKAIEAVSPIFANKSKMDQALETPVSGNEDPAAIIMGYLRGGYTHDFDGPEPAHTETACTVLGEAMLEPYKYFCLIS